MYEVKMSQRRICTLNLRRQKRLARAVRPDLMRQQILRKANARHIDRQEEYLANTVSM